MSGPKTSRYTLTAAQRRQLAIQRERRIKRQAEINKIEHWKAVFSQVVSGFSQAAERAAALMEREHDDCGWNEAMEQLKAETDKAILALGAIHEESTLEECQQANEAAGKANTRIAALTGKLSAIDQRVSLALEKSVAVDVDAGFRAGFSFDSPQAEAAEGSQAGECLMQLRSLREKDVSVLLCEEIDQAIARLRHISGDDYLKNFRAITMDPLVRKSEDYLAAQERIRERFREQMPLYEALCREANVAPERYSPSRTGLELLEAEILRLQELVAAAQEQAYISRCIDEAMEEMGYELIGDREITKRSGRKFRNELYRFAEGTAVNVTYASDGQITMELGAMDRVDRIPTLSEAERLREDMEVFCGGYQKLERYLLQKGVVSSHILLLPPQEEYAMVINTSDYQMTDAARETKRKKKEEGRLYRHMG